MKTKLIIFLSIISSFIIIKNVFADVKIISKNPDYLKRGKLFGEARIANAYGQVNYKPNYKIILKLYQKPLQNLSKNLSKIDPKTSPKPIQKPLQNRPPKK